jgi:hypothetical protein
VPQELANVAPVQVSAIGEARFTAEARLEGTTMSVRMEGTADAKAKPHFQSFFDRVHRSSIDSRVGDAVVDVQRLAFMSSSCFKDVLVWIMNVNAEPPETRYRIRFVPDPKRGWQKRGFRALVLMAPELVSIDEIEGTRP